MSIPLLSRCDIPGRRSVDLAAIITAADAVISAVDTTALAAFQALRPPAEDEQSTTTTAATAGGAASSSSSSSGGGSSKSSSGGAETGDAGGGVEGVLSYKAEKKQMDEAKAALLEALSRKLAAQLDMAEVGEKGGGALQGSEERGGQGKGSLFMS